jgi:hypothetical protein
MPIQIIDNFDLNSAKPIDNRFVVGSQSFYTTKDSISYKYPGMRVWDLNDGVPYVWTGTTFSSENSVSISGSGIVNYIPKYISTNVIGNSLIYDTGVNVGIGTISPAYKFDVNGDVRSQGTNGYYGVGSNLTALTATNITLGSLSLARITNGTTGQLLVAGTSQPEWRNASLVTVGTASAVSITNDTSSATTMYPVFSTSTSGTSGLRTSSTKLQFVPSTGTLYVAGNVGLGVAPSTERLKVSGNVLLTGTTTVIGLTRINKSSSAFEIGATSLLTNLEVITSSTSTQLKIYNPSSPSTYNSSITQFSSYTEYLGSGRTYFNVADAGTRLITFGRSGLNDQINFYMDNSTLNVPVVGGKGVYIEYNLRVNGTLSKSSGTFQIEHPLESKRKTHTLVHSFIEGPQADLIYRGSVSLIDGVAEINIDEHSTMTEGTFVELNRNVQCFTSNETGWSSVKGVVIGNILKIESDDTESTDHISWMVIGERKDKHMMETNWTDDNGKVIVEPRIV